MALPILDGNQTAATLSTIITGGAHIPAHTVVSLGSQAISDISNAVSSVQVSGTVTANARSDIYDGVNDVYYNKSVIAWGNPFLQEPTPVEQSTPLPVSGTVTIGSLPAISGTVTANIGNVSANLIGVDTPRPQQGIAIGYLTDSKQYFVSVDEDSGLPVRITGDSQTQSIFGTVTIGSSVTIGSLPAISGTVTANNPNGALTTRFGSVTTANTAQITSAVTNTSRKYLLAQNISAGTVTIGIGFSPTTTQGIQLTAGAGLTFDAFCPTGAVYWLGAVTGATFTILEG